MDVSKKEIVFYADARKKHYTVPNTIGAIQQFLRDYEFNPKETVIGCEATCDFHSEPCLTCLDMGYPVKVLNPILTNQVTKATVRKKKTDSSDAEIIAKLIADGHGQFVTKESFQQGKRTMLRTEQKLVECTSLLKKVYLSLQVKGKFMDVEDALLAVGRCIDALEYESQELTEKATRSQNRQEEIIDSVPGCGQKLAAIISAEAGDIKRFPSSRQFKAYVGLDPKVSQSGPRMYLGRMTKRGNPILRHALFMAANVSRQFDPDMKAFYEKKKAEGKSYRHTICAVSRKLCERIYAIVTKDEFYRKRKMPT